MPSKPMNWTDPRNVNSKTDKHAKLPAKKKAAKKVKALEVWVVLDKWGDVVTAEKTRAYANTSRRWFENNAYEDPYRVVKFREVK